MLADDSLTQPLPPVRPKPVRQARAPEQTSAAILAAAMHEFTQKGFSGARIDAIARRSGANKRMIYHYFASKEGLYLAALESVYTAIRFAEAKLHLGERDPVEGMGELVRFTWRYFLAHPEFLSLLATENLHKARYLKRSSRILGLHPPLIDTIGDLLRRGAADGRFRDGVDPVQLYVSIAALGSFYLSNRHTLSAIFRRELVAPEALQTWEQHMVEVILGSLRA